MKLIFFCLLQLIVVCIYAQTIVPGRVPGTTLKTTPRTSKPTYSLSSKIYTCRTPIVSKRLSFILQIDEYKNGVKQNTSEQVCQETLEKGQCQTFIVVPETINNDSTLRILFNFISVEFYKYRHSKSENVFKWKSYEKVLEEKVGESIPILLFYEDNIESGFLEKELNSVIGTNEIPSATNTKQLSGVLKKYYVVSYTLKE